MERAPCPCPFYADPVSRFDKLLAQVRRLSNRIVTNYSLSASARVRRFFFITSKQERNHHASNPLAALAELFPQFTSPRSAVLAGLLLALVASSDALAAYEATNFVSDIPRRRQTDGLPIWLIPGDRGEAAAPSG